MIIVPALIWKLEGESLEVLDARLLLLRQAVAAWKSLTKAAEDCQISNRAARGLLQRTLGEPLVLLERPLRPAAYRRLAKSGKVRFSS